VWLIPWDLDHTFEEPSPVRNYFDMPDWDDLDASCTPIPLFLGVDGRPPSCDRALLRPTVSVLWDRYEEESTALIDGAFSDLAMAERVTYLEGLIAAAIEEDPDVHALVWSGSVATLRSDIDAKRAHVQDKLRSR